MSNFLRDVVKQIGQDNISVLEDGLSSGELGGWIDTGSYALNAALSGSMYGGVPDNRVTAFAGREATGKTFFALGLMYAFQRHRDNGGIFHFDTESATTREMMESRGIDPARVTISEPETVQQFRTTAVNILDYYTDLKDKPPMMVVLDSLGMLPSGKELEDITKGSDTRDMTRTQLIRAAFRVLTLKLAKAGVPMIITNHTYQTMEMYSADEMSGGGGVKYAASTIVTLTKAQDMDGTDRVGSFITCTVNKSRFTREKKKVRVRLSFDHGLDRYYGLLDIAEKYSVFVKEGKQFVIDGKKYHGKTINDNPEKFYTPEVMEQLEIACAKEFKFGSDNNDA